jgi:hypothetical protein
MNLQPESIIITYVDFSGLIVYANVKDNYYNRINPNLFRFELSFKDFPGFIREYKLKLHDEIFKQCEQHLALRN